MAIRTSRGTYHTILSLARTKLEKVRIGFSCASVHDATSLKSQILQGTDLSKKLLGILFRFRHGRVAIMADIKAMFHQIRVTPQHQDALLFLWWMGICH